jgi:hypothetical protein
VRYFIIGALGTAVLAFQPDLAAAQCVGGTVVAGYYRGDGSYVSGGCATTSPFIPGQLISPGAASAPITSSATVVPSAGAPRAAVAPGENDAGVGRAQGGGAPATGLRPAGDSTGAYGRSLTAAPASPTAEVTGLLVAGDPTGAYGTSLPAAMAWREEVTSRPTTESE